MSRPLSGYKIIELAGIGPGPYAGQLFADLGAEVISVERPGGSVTPGASGGTVDRRGKRSIIVDLRKPEGVSCVLKLVENADALFEGNRPGVAERLGVGPDDCQAVNPKLVYGRMTGWGQTGPWANMAGHDINYLSITGALQAIGERNSPPPPPLNFLGDYGGGTLNLVVGILTALLRAEKTGKGDVIDAAIIDGVSSMMGIIYSLDNTKLWQVDRHSNLLDGGMPFYRCYKTSDDKFMAVGCIEPQFFAKMLTLLNIDPESFGAQMNPKNWARQHKVLEGVFATRTRDEWAKTFDDTDACVTPVLNYKEAVTHKQNVARGGLKTVNGMVHPRTMPVFRSCDKEPDFVIPVSGQDTKDVLTDLGLSEDEIGEIEAHNKVRSYDR